MNPSKMQIVGLSYRDVARAFGAMPRTFTIAFLICFVYYAIATFLVPALVEELHGAAREVISFALGAGAAFLLTPFFIAIHRFILLDELPSGYLLDIHNPRFMRFFAFGMLIVVLFEVPIVLASLWGAKHTLFLGAYLGAAMLGLQLTLIFPATAVDAPGAGWMNAVADARGHLWFILFTGLMALVPALCALLAVIAVDMSMQGVRAYKMSIIAHLILFMLTVPLQAILVAIASHLFRAFANRLGGVALARRR